MRLQRRGTSSQVYQPSFVDAEREFFVITQLHDYRLELVKYQLATENVQCTVLRNQWELARRIDDWGVRLAVVVERERIAYEFDRKMH